ncbi:hypothetical protein LUZ60_001831 [Juncus effusus]|nr:hypothetical protein LUZ60_001831 [Juncus effusus]
MILRTPPQRKRRAEAPPEPYSAGGDVEQFIGGSGTSASAVSDRRVVIYGDRAVVPVDVDEPEEGLICTYHCRQMVKSEFMVAFDAAEKQNLEYKSQLEALSEKLYNSDYERQKYKEEAELLEQELEASKARENSLQERLLKEINDSQERYVTQLKKISELEMELNKEIEARKAVEKSTEPLKENLKDLEMKLESLSSSAKREKSSLKRELYYCQDDTKLSLSRLTAELETTRMRAESSESETELLQEQLMELQNQFDQCLKEKTELEQNLCTSNIPSFNNSPSEDKKLIKILQEEIHNYEKEVQEAKYLKSSQIEGELLKEKLMEEKSKRERAELELSKLNEIEAKSHKLELELNQWKSLLNEIPDVSSFSDIPDKFAELRMEALENMAKVSEINGKLKELEISLQFADISKKSAESVCELAKEKAESKTLEVLRLERMLASITEEKERLRKDMTRPKDDSLVKELEAVLREKEGMIKELESNLHEQSEIMTHRNNEITILNERLNDELRKNKSLERENDRLRHELALLESKLGHGDYSSSNTKVMRMINTLALENEAKQTIEALQSELKKTTERLRAVEELKGQYVDDNVPEKLLQLKNQVAVLEKREERYKSVFAEKISVFRRACCSLFGYKITMDDQKGPNGIPVTRFTLQSIYAQSDYEKLEFDYESGTANILVNEYTSESDIAQQIEIFIRKMNSIPAFTANLTMDMFNKQTLS